MEGPGGVPGTGDVTAGGAAPAAENSQEVGVHHVESSGVKGGGGVPDNGVVHLATTEHGFTVHCCVITDIPV